MISDSDLERIGRRIEAEFEGVKAHNFHSDHQFIRGIGLEANGRYRGFRILPTTHEQSLLEQLRRWCRDQKRAKSLKNLEPSGSRSC